MTKAIKLPNNAGRMNYGQIIRRGGDPMKSNPQRGLNTAVKNLARNGAPKNTDAAPIKPGVKRVTSGESAAYHHGVTVGDEPNTTKTFESPTPLHPATPARIANKVHSVGNDPKAVLDEAARLGRKA